jgi:error-prone DNA polymerase
MTLEDETAIANVIVWPKTFEIFRPQVLGARLISVTGKLQNESGVIHVVADTIQDLTPLLRRLSGGSHCASDEAAVDVAVGPAAEGSSRPVRGRHPRMGDALVTLLKDDPGVLDDPISAPHPAEVMPKGRNFH